MNQYDVLVVGGGFSGCAAALAAARGGAKVLLAEETGALGGAPNTMLILPFMPHCTPIGGDAADRTILSQGIFLEICERLIAFKKQLEGENAAYTDIPMSIFSEEHLKMVLDHMMAEAGVRVLFHAKLYKADAAEGKISSLTFSVTGGSLTMTANTYIDCTGDAELAYLGGFPTRLGREGDSLCQPMTLCFRVGDVDIPRFRAARAEMQKQYKICQQNGEIDCPREDILVFDTVSPTVLHFNTTRVILKNPTDPYDVTEAEIEGRRQVYDIFRFLRKYVPGCEHATLLSTASHIGIRESRMIEGEYVLTQEDLLACRKFDDGIAACNYDIDIHNPEGSGTSHYYFKPYTYYTIPYRCLLPKGTKNLLVAGRCISSTHEAQASYRIMPVVCTLGEAAGTAAAIALSDGVGVAEVNIETLKDTLRKNGAFIEPTPVHDAR